MMGRKAGCPTCRMQQNSNAFQEDPWHNPETYSPKAGEQVGDTHLPYHATEQGYASKKKTPNNELGDAHATLETFGGSLDDDSCRHTQCRCASSAPIRWWPILSYAPHQRTSQVRC